MSYEQLAQAVDNLAVSNSDLKANVLVVKTSTEQARDAAQAFAINAVAVGAEVHAELLTAEMAATVAAATEVVKGVTVHNHDAAAHPELTAFVSGEATRATTAADTAQLSAGIYDTTALGLAATTNGKYFNTPSPDTNEHLILYKNNAGAALEIKRYPNAAYVAAARLTSGDVFNSVTTFGQAFNGGVLVVGSDGRNIGLTIPAGQTGNTTYFRAELGLSSQIANLVGAKITIDMYLDATPNFVTDTVFTSLVMQVLRAGSFITVTPDSQSLTQVGGTIHKVVTYTIQAGDSDVCPVFRPGISTTVADRTVTMKSVSYAITSIPSGMVTLSDYHLQQRLSPLASAIATNTLTSGEKMDGNLFAWNGESLGGSVRLNDPLGNLIGLTVPSGQSGGTGYFSPFFKIDGARLAGAKISVTTTFNATANFTTDAPPSGTALQVNRGTGPVNVAPLNLKVSQSGLIVTKTFDYIITAADVAIAPTYQISAAAQVAAYVRSISVQSIKYTLSALPAGLTAADALLSIQVNAAISKIAVRGAEGTVVVADTGGDYTTIAAANTALASASLAQPTTALLKHNEDLVNVSLNDYVSLRGVGAELTVLSHEMPADVPQPNVPNQQTLYVFRNHTLENLKITAKNMRYPVHCESSGTFRNGTIEVIDCDIEHLGNQTAQDYQDANKTGLVVWTSEHAWGYGASSGQKLIMRRGKLKSRTSAFYVHTNLAFDKPLDMRLEGQRLIATNDTGKAVYVQPLGSGQRDRLTLVGNMLMGDIYYWMNPWMPNTLEYQPANHCEIKIVGYGNSPAVFEIAESGRALKIQSITDGPTSKLTVSGDAVDILFGKKQYTLSGCVGIPGYVYGWADISGVSVGSPTVGNITSLGKRLGNCSAVNKTLSVLVDGVTTKVMVFNQDYTAQTNAAILATINTALGGLATASEYNIGGRYRPVLTDEELDLKNNSSVGILMGMALAYDGHHKKVRKMTASDSPSLFAGIAWEDIYPGEFGRVKVKGYLSRVDLYGNPGTFSYGQVLYVSDTTPGQLTLTVGANPIMRAIRSDAVQVAAK